ncbi:MAG: hypothetical protein M3Y56_15490 [Armatimonadota bacterium]|nr:hypothetical protein [Armatimonadota bacterium]
MKPRLVGDARRGVPGQNNNRFGERDPYRLRQVRRGGRTLQGAFPQDTAHVEVQDGGILTGSNVPPLHLSCSQD